MCVGLGANLLHAQTAWQIETVQISSEKPLPQQKRLIRNLQNAQDSLSAVIILNEYCEQRAQEGYAACYWEKAFREAAHLSVQINLGPLYLLTALQLQGLPPQYQQKLGLDRLLRKSRPLQWTEIQNVLDLGVRLYQDEGYPFAAFGDLEV
ncbi:MAG: hypothetical protein AAGM67_09315, partial [Bacteroidota bacterium]